MGRRRRLAKGRKHLSLANFWKPITFIGNEQISRTLLVLMSLFKKPHGLLPQPSTVN